MPTKNENWDPSSDEIPNCDDCGASCERGCSMRWKGDKIDVVWCFDCRDRRDLSDWRQSKRLTSHFMTTTIIKYANAEREGNVPVREAYEGPWHSLKIVELAVKQFRVSVWPIVHRQVNEERKLKGMSVERDGLKVMTFAMCGRIRVHVQRGDVWCAAQGAEESASQGLGLHGIDATSEEAAKLWEDAIALFKDGGKLVADREVGIL